MKALELFGAASSTELAGRLPLMYNERMYDVLKGLLSALFKGETHYAGEPAGVEINGEQKHLLVMWTVVSGREGDLSEVLAVRVDVTDRFQSIEERRRERLSLERLAGGAVSSVSGQMLGLGTLRERASEVFDRLVERYCEALEAALEEKIYKTEPDTSGKLKAMAEELGLLKAGPRDVVDIHAKALKIKSTDAPPKKAQAYAVEGRIVVLELMGFLAAHYRNYSAGLSKLS
ncbi:MAG TPA: hypothetical protein ENN21_04275 [Spirochaetes bacterium]|nr:hypothetical protein [Spirochaetota bacterium]